MRVVTQGEDGSFHHRITRLWFGDHIQITSAATFEDVFDTLKRQEADAAVVAIENSLYGSIDTVLDLIESYRYPIVGEAILRVHQQLIGLPGAKPSEITRIYSQVMAIAQCDHYLTAHYPNAERIEYHDTAASVRHIKEMNDPHFAAIASSSAAAHHHLPIIAKDIEDNAANQTRFLIIKPSVDSPVPHPNKSSLVVRTKHTPGALAHVLTIFGKAGINLTKLQSRPIAEDTWRYQFYIDVETAGEKLHELLSEIRQTGATVTILGEYAAGKVY